MSIDGGNIVRWHDAVIVTDKIYGENRDIERPRLRTQVRTALEVDQLIVVPKEPYDTIGHADGMIRFVDERTVLVNDYACVEPAFGNRLIQALAGLEIVPFPYVPTDNVIDGIDSSEGVYINFLQVSGTIFLPVFGFRQDEMALKLLGRVFPDSRIIPVPSNELAREGGVLNCVTWTIKTSGD